MTDVKDNVEVAKAATSTNGQDDEKAAKLAHYAESNLTHFVQYDVFTRHWDSFIQPDEDGMCMFRVETHELMSGLPAVRVLVSDGTEGRQAVDALLKIVSAIKHDGIPCGCTDHLWAQFVRLGRHVFRICRPHGRYELFTGELTRSVKVSRGGDVALEAFKGLRPLDKKDSEALLYAISYPNMGQPIIDDSPF